MALNLTGKETIKQSLVVNVEEYMTGKVFLTSEENLNFSIQYCQREYEWEQTNIQDLLFTIFRENFSEIGNIITQPIENHNNKITTISLLDGQQRTITLSFIASFLEYILDEKKAIDKEKERIVLNQQQLDLRIIDKKLDSTYGKYSEKVNILKKIILNDFNGTELPRLCFDNSSEFNNFYEKFIQNRTTIIKIFMEDCRKNEKFKKLEKLYPTFDVKNKTIQYALHAFEYIAVFLKMDLEVQSNIINKNLYEISQYVDKFLKTHITVEMFSINMNPSIIFENRNNKGKNLNAVNILKNTFIIAKNKYDEQNNVLNIDQRNEKEINHFFKSKNKKHDDYFNKYIYSLFRITFPVETLSNSIISLDKLIIFLNYSNINQGAWTFKHTVDFFELLKNKESIYNKITGVETPFSEAKIYFYLLKKLNLISLYTPILLKYYPTTNNDVEKKQFLKLLQDILRSFFICIYNGKNNFDISNNMFKQAPLNNLIENLEKKITLEENLRNKFHFKSIEESKLIDEFNSYTFSRDAQKGILFLYELIIKYDLIKIKDIDNIGIDIKLNEKIEIEHIIPKNPKVKHNIHSVDLEKIGNLVLLEDKANESASNEPFNIKKKIYLNKKQSFEQIKELSQLTNFSNVQDIDVRNDKLIKKIYKFLDLI
jgi:hypothetical protein